MSAARAVRERYAAAPACTRVRLLLVGVVAIAIAVRCTDLGARLTIDDAYSWFTASAPNPHVFLARLAANENSPPLIYALIGLLPSFAPAWLRLPAVIPGVLLCVVVFGCLRTRFGGRAALLAALMVAVAPYLVTYSNLARGFMLADVALMIMIWSLLSLRDGGRAWKWVAFVAAGVMAVYSEYGSVVFIIALCVAALWIGRPRRTAVLIASGLVLLALAAWIPEIVRGQDQVGRTKFSPLDATPSLTAVRDLVATLAFGEHGATSSGAGRWLIVAVFAVLVTVGARLLSREWAERSCATRDTARLLAATLGLTLVGSALASLVGVDIFTQRYLTAIVGPAAGLAAWALTCVPSRWLVPAVALGLIVLGAGNAVRRLGTEFEPSLAPVRVLADSLHPQSVLTNTPVVLYYLRSFHPEFDRPYNIGPGGAATCARPCLVIDDSRVHGGTPRPAAGAVRAIGPFSLVSVP